LLSYQPVDLDRIKPKITAGSVTFPRAETQIFVNFGKKKVINTVPVQYSSEFLTDVGRAPA
jgi:hypothetical protein